MNPFQILTYQSNYLSLLIACLGCLMLACSPKTESPPLFSQLSADETGIDFVNQLDYNKAFNIYTYRNFYNGGGVAVGDINNDGLLDVYFTANMRANKLYLNKGNLQFEDISERAKVAGSRAWSTGVTMADVNGDGLLDIYVCNSGDIQGDNKQNELFINQGGNIPSFSEEAEAYGLADKGYGTHASFFDYDKDGDLDVYLLNNSYTSIFDFESKRNQRYVRDELGGDRFFRNDGNIFTEVSEEVGIYSSEIGFGLGITVGDVDRDGWLDMFISNDFFERDYLYMNQGDGTFKEDLENQIQSLSVASMGADMADINNDGYPEIFVTEMLPEGEARFKTKMTFENWDVYQKNLRNDYYHQFTRNVLQLNNGNRTFSEIGRLAGIEATDWSWGALMADYDNDGLTDLFVSNGLAKDIIDQDYINFVSSEAFVRQMRTPEGINFKVLIDTIPSTRIANYLFKNQGEYSFDNVATDWGLSTPSHSNGSVYADLDNDGDLELIVNNVNMPAFVYENHADSLLNDHNYLKVKVKGKDQNTFAIGSNITLKVQGKTYYSEIIPIRGFQSSVDYRPNFGLGVAQIVDSLIINWPDGTQDIFTEISANQTLVLEQEKNLKDQQGPQHFSEDKALTFKEITHDIAWGFSHTENPFIDFDRDRLIYHMVSTEGPAMCKADVNGDGLEDIYIGGAQGYAGAMFLQQAEGKFGAFNQALFEQDMGGEDLDCTFFDADNDGDQDLYIARGGNEFLISKEPMNDQLYLNKGDGRFSRSPQFLPSIKPESSACVVPGDYDADGDQDLFIGIGLIPGYYGISGHGYILNNDGKGKFSNISKQIAPSLERIGMVKDAAWLDFDDDKDLDLVLIGEWMPITLLENNKGRFSKAKTIPYSEGWWNCMEQGDFDNDGDMDFVLGNHGLNSRFSATKDRPISIHVNDFDRNKTPEPIISQYNGETSYPMVLRHDLVMQLPHLKKKYLLYHNYKEQTIEDMFSLEEMKGTVKKYAHYLESAILLNNGNGKFELRALPKSAQFSPTYGLHVEDMNQDGNLDILLGGNLYGAKPEVGRYDANYGLMLKGKGDGTFSTLRSKETGFQIKGQTREIISISTPQEKLLLVAKNNERMQVFSY